jgi:hypothetical protein
MLLTRFVIAFETVERPMSAFWSNVWRCMVKFLKISSSRLYALFALLLLVREPRLAVVVQNAKMLLQSKQVANLSEIFSECNYPF